MGKAVIPAASIGELPEAHLIEIGKIVMGWAQLEQNIRAAIRSIAGITDHRIGRIVTSTLPARTAIDMLRAVAKERLSADVLEWFCDNIVNPLGTNCERRNDIDHAVWWNPTDERDVPHRESFKRLRAEPELEPEALASLIQLRDKINELDAMLMIFLTDHGFPLLAP